MQHENSDEFYLAAAQNLPPALADKSCLLMEGSCTCLNSYKVGGLDNRDRVNVITCSRLEDLMQGTNGLRYHASIPLYARQKKLGVLNVASEEWQWWESSADILTLLHTVGDMLSIAIERTHLFDQSIQLGVTEERNRLAREIHDTLAQGLTGIALQLEAIDAMLESGAEPEKIRQSVGRTLDITRTNLEEARRSVLDLRAATLVEQNLADALAALTEDVSSRENLHVELTVTGSSRPLPTRIEAGLYRIVQEGLTNIARHAAAGQVAISLSLTPALAQLLMEDDGRGFDPDHVPQGSFGLIGLSERVKLLGGKLKLESSPGEGVRVEVNIPLGQEANNA